MELASTSPPPPLDVSRTSWPTRATGGGGYPAGVGDFPRTAIAVCTLSAWSRSGARRRGDPHGKGGGGGGRRWKAACSVLLLSPPTAPPCRRAGRASARCPRFLGVAGIAFARGSGRGRGRSSPRRGTPHSPRSVRPVALGHRRSSKHRVGWTRCADRKYVSILQRTGQARLAMLADTPRAAAPLVVERLPRPTWRRGGRRPACPCWEELLLSSFPEGRRRRPRPAHSWLRRSPGAEDMRLRAPSPDQGVVERRQWAVSRSKEPLPPPASGGSTPPLTLEEVAEAERAIEAWQEHGGPPARETRRGWAPSLVEALARRAVVEGREGRAGRATEEERAASSLLRRTPRRQERTALPVPGMASRGTDGRPEHRGARRRRERRPSWPGMKRAEKKRGAARQTGGGRGRDQPSSSCLRRHSPHACRSKRSTLEGSPRRSCRRGGGRDGGRGRGGRGRGSRGG